jgi:hypothetical protein
MLHSKVDTLALTNIRLGWKGLPGTNTPAYYKHSYMTEEKSFITLAPKCQCYKPLYVRNLRMFVKVFVQGRPFQPSLMFLGKATSLN